MITPPGFPDIALRVGEMLSAYPSQSGGQRQAGAGKAEEVS